jgi:hypothetical protein
LVPVRGFCKIWGALVACGRARVRGTLFGALEKLWRGVPLCDMMGYFNEDNQITPGTWKCAI